MKNLIDIINEKLIVAKHNNNIKDELIETDLKIIKDSLITSNFKKASVSSAPRYVKLWYIKESIILNSGALFQLADFEDLPPINEGKYEIFVKFVKNEKEMVSVLFLGAKYVNINGKTIRLERTINLDYKEYQTPGKFVKYLNNVLFNDEQSAVDTFKDIKEIGKEVCFF